jgi:hypothetical protein
MSIIFQVQKTSHNWTMHDSTTNVKGGAFKQWFIENLNLQLKIDKVEILFIFHEFMFIQKNDTCNWWQRITKQLQTHKLLPLLIKSIFYD